MKTVGMLVAALALSIGAARASGGADAADWRLQAFDEANGCLARMQANEQAFIVGKEPKLAGFYQNVLVPWQDAMQRLRRLVFIRKMKGAAEPLRMSESPWVWALGTPARQDEIEKWLKDDPDGAVRAAYDEVRRRSQALGPAGDMVQLRNEVVERFKPEVRAIEGAVVGELNALEDRVRKDLAAPAPASP
jgi:hypothetical protein